MLGKSAGSGGLADPPCVLRREPRQDFRDSRPIGSHQDLSARLEELANAFPSVGNDAGACSGGLEYACRGAVAECRHAVTADVQNRVGRRIEGIMITGVDMA